MTVADSVLFALLGGIALLLCGIRLVGDGLQKAAGARQSSSATTVILVGFASAGLLTLRQTVGVILGADTGTTVTVQLLAFDVLGFAPLVVFAGWLLVSAARGFVRYIGEAILGLGLVFLGIHLDLLASLKRANSLVTGIAHAVLGRHTA